MTLLGLYILLGAAAFIFAFSYEIIKPALFWPAYIAVLLINGACVQKSIEESDQKTTEEFKIAYSSCSKKEDSCNLLKFNNKFNEKDKFVLEQLTK